MPVTRQEHDAVERLQLLRERGLLDVGRSLADALDRGDVAVVRYLRTAGLLTVAGALNGGEMRTAMVRGDVAVAVELLAAGSAIDTAEVLTAARHGHLHVLRWMAKGPEAAPAAAEALRRALQDEGEVLFENGAASGSMELVEWLWERGCRGNERAFTAAAGAGNAALLARLVTWGCPMSSDACLSAGQRGDMVVLRFLRKLGCP